MSQLVLLAIIPSEWQSVSATHSNKEKQRDPNALFIIPDPAYAEGKKQTSSTATFNQTAPHWRPFLALKGTSALELFAECVLMRDTSLSNQVNHITSAPDFKKSMAQNNPD